MGFHKNYALDLVVECGQDNAFAQDAVDFAIGKGLVKLCFNKQKDVEAIMRRYDEIVQAYHRELEGQAQRAAAEEAASIGVPFFEEIDGRRVA